MSTRLPTTFLEPSERERFIQPGSFFERTVIQTGQRPLDVESRRESKLSLLVESKLKSLLRRNNRWFEAISISVRDDDGISWSAEKAMISARQVCPQHFSIWCLSDKVLSDSLPSLSTLIGKNDFLRLAAKCGLTKKFLSLRSWTTFAIVLAAILLGFVVEFLQIYLKTSLPPGPASFVTLLQDQALYVTIFFIAVLGLASKQLATYLTTQTKSKSIESFLEDLSTKIATIEYSQFVESLAHLLACTAFPRIVVIDNYEAIDFTTKRVIDRYFEKYSGEAQGSEFWIVFERMSGDRFSSAALKYPDTYGYGHTSHYEQALLTEKEKDELVRKRNRPERSKQFSTIKAICHESEEGAEWVRKYLADYRIQHPKRGTDYDALDFLSFMALTSLPGHVFISERTVTQGLSSKTALRSQLLPFYLRGTQLRKDELQRILSEVQKKFHDLLLFDGPSNPANFQVKLEVSEILKLDHDKLDLPPTEVGHLFWGLYWHDKLRSHPLEAVWIRKLSYHLLESDVFSITDRGISHSTSAQLFEALLFASSACLQVCVFDSVPSLLHKALNLLQSDESLDQGPTKKRFLRKCWDCYLLLGDERILTCILETYHSLMPHDGPEDSAWENPLDKLFFDTIPISPEKRSFITPSFLSLAVGQSERGESVTSYARARSIWYCLTSEPFWKSGAVVEMTTAFQHGKQGIVQIASSTTSRIDSSNDPLLRLTDYMALSILLWSYPLAFETLLLNDFYELLLNQIRLSSSTPSTSLTATSNPSVAKSLLCNLVSMAEDAILVAATAKAIPADIPKISQGYLLNDALAKDLCGTSIAAIIIGVLSLKDREANILDETIVKRISEIVTYANEIMKYSLPEVKSMQDLLSPAFIKKTGSLLEFSSLVWDQFGLERQRDFSKAKQCQFFGLLARQSNGRQLHIHDEVLLRLGTSINQYDFSGLLSNMVAANVLRKAAELSAHYLIQSGTIALRQDFSQDTKRNISLMIVLYCHTLPADLNTFLNTILDDKSDRTMAFLETAFDGIQEEGWASLFLALLNASRRSDVSDTKVKVYSILSAKLGQVSSEPCKDELSALIELSQLRDRLSQGERVDLRTLHQRWACRQQHWLYPSFLLTLFRQNSYDELTIDEAISILDRDPMPDSANTYFHLAKTLCEFLLDADRRDDTVVPIQYLRLAIERWKSSLIADENVQVYRILHELDPENRSQHLGELLKWEDIKIQRDHLKRIPELMREGSYFLVFDYYCRTMRFWGLDTDVSNKDYLCLMRLNPDDKTEYVVHWKEEGSIVPEPLVSNVEGTRVSSRFLALGHFLFSTPLDHNPSFDQDRRLFDNAARGSLQALLDVIAALPSLPEAIRQLLAKYANRLDEYTAPVE